MTNGGIHLMLNVNPDIAVFAKGMANGYAMAAVIGTERVMQAAQSTFISSTNWTERIGPTAAIATIQKFCQQKVAQHLIDIGKRVLQGWETSASATGLKLHTSGLPSLCHFTFEHEDELVLTTLFTQIMLEKSYLAYNQFKPSYAHTLGHVSNYLTAVEEAFGILSEGLERGDLTRRLKGPVAKRGFYRLA
jgi:glutamate-1-semialdehyde aminotransferase